MKNNESLKNWNVDYTGAAIYSLVDSEGKRYIGQAMNLKRRLYMHKKEFDKLKKDPGSDTCEGSKLATAIRNGSRFEVEILKLIPWKNSTVNVLRYWEMYFVNQYGGLENTYNTADVTPPNFNCENFNCISLVIDLSKELDIIQYLKQADNPEELIKDLIRQGMKSPEIIR